MSTAHRASSALDPASGASSGSRRHARRAAGRICRGTARTSHVGQRPGEERLPAAGRPVEQQPAAQALAVEGPQRLVAQRGEERRLQPLLHRVHAADVGQPEVRPLHREPPASRRPPDRHHLGLLPDDVVGGEARADDVLDLVLGRRPVEAGRRAGPGRLLRGRAGTRRGRSERPGHQRGGVGVTRLLPEHGRDVRDRLLTFARPEQELREVQAERDVPRRGGDGRPQAREQGVGTGHAVQGRSRTSGHGGDLGADRHWATRRTRRFPERRR
jgi:hypothetical protein